MTAILEITQSENIKQLNQLPASESQPLDGRVLALQEFLMDRFGTGLGVPPLLLCHPRAGVQTHTR
jgi:hypothetical protein